MRLKLPRNTVMINQPGIGWTPLGLQLGSRVQGDTREHALPGGPARMQLAVPGVHRVLPGSPIAVWNGSCPVWTGEVESTDPDPVKSVTSLTARGTADASQDGLIYDKSYVHANISEWVDTRSYGNVTHAAYPSQFKVSSADGIAEIAVPRGVTVTAGQQGGLTIDAGPDSANWWKRLVLTYRGGGHADYALLVGVGATAGTTTDIYTLDAAAIATSDTTVAQTFTTTYRFVTIYLECNLTGATADATAYVKLLQALLFTATAYESGNASILTGAMVAADIVANAGIPNISASSARIQAGTIALQELVSSSDNPRSLLDRANASDNRQWLFSSNAVPELIMREAPTKPRWILMPGEYTIEGGALSSNLQDVYNEVDVRWTGPDRAKNITTVTLTPDTTILARLGRTRKAVINVTRTCSSAEAAGIGAAFLREHLNPPMRAAIKTTRGYIRTYEGHQRMPVDMVTAGDVLLVAGLRDPAVGAIGRQGVIHGVTASGSNAQISLDSDTTIFDRLLAKFEAAGRK